jgi:putative DNA primase/helicase
MASTTAETGVIEQETRLESPQSAASASRGALKLRTRDPDEDPGRSDCQEVADAVARPRPWIVITTEEHEVIDQAVSALRAEPRLFQRAGVLVRLLSVKKSRRRRGVERPQGGKRIVALHSAQLRRLLTIHAAWYDERPTSKGETVLTPAHPAGFAIEGVATLGVWPGIRALEGIVEAPTLRPDGSLLDRPGYDPATGLWLEPEGRFPPVPDRPTREAVESSVALLNGIVSDFPFQSEHAPRHRAAWLAALLTPLARPAIDGPCPLFLFDANCPGTGKSKLCDIIAILATGREMPRGSYSDNQEEMQKMILSAALAADQLMLFDNVPSGTAVGGSALDRALTARTIKGRILGRSEMTPDLTMDIVFFATGNNLALKGDALRRVVPCRLESAVERPEGRNDFRIPGDLLAHVKQQRGPLIAAALTILRGYIAAGRPDQGLTPMDYPAWCGLIRNAVNWATGTDPCAARALMVQSDEDTCQLRGLIEGWETLCRERAAEALTCSEVLEALEAEASNHLELRGILLNWSKDAKLPSPRVVGNHLNKFRGRVGGGKALQFVQQKGNRAWFIKSVVPAHRNQPVRGPKGSEGSEGSLQPNREDDLSDAERKEVADVLAEVRHSRNQTRLPNGRVREVIR